MKQMTPYRGPMSRRNFLKIGGLTLGGLGAAGIVPWKLQAESLTPNPSPSGRGESLADTAVILIWLPGGPPHMEMYDMKPDAPAEYRGDFRPVHTNVPGIDVCEHLPMHTRIADKFTIIRSIAHTFSDHGGGHKRFLTGRDPASPVGGQRSSDGRFDGLSRAPAARAAFPITCAALTAAATASTSSASAARIGPSVHRSPSPAIPTDPNFQVRICVPSSPRNVSVIA